MISLSSNKNFESYSNRNFSFSESNESDCSVFPEFPFFFKKAKELSQEDLKSQSSQCINISEKENEIEENMQNNLNWSKSIYLEEEEEDSNSRIYLQKNIHNQLNEYFNIPILNKKKETNEKKIENKKPMFLVKHKRGRKGKPSEYKKVKPTKNKKEHTKNSFDNAISKVQNHYISFIIDLVNYIIKLEFKGKKDFQFGNINYDFKKKVSFDHIQNLKKHKIKDILQKEISKKSKIKNKEHNKFIYEEINNSQDNNLLKEVFEMNYLKFFKNFYYNNGQKKDTILIKETEIKLSENINPFYKLSKDDIQYNQKLMDSIKIAYFDGDEKNLFKTSCCQNKINN